MQSEPGEGKRWKVGGDEGDGRLLLEFPTWLGGGWCPEDSDSWLLSPHPCKQCDLHSQSTWNPPGDDPGSSWRLLKSPLPSHLHPPQWRFLVHLLPTGRFQECKQDHGLVGDRNTELMMESTARGSGYWVLVWWLVSSWGHPDITLSLSRHQQGKHKELLWLRLWENSCHSYVTGA